MADEEMVLYTAIYESRDAALADLAVFENLHDQSVLGKYDAAVIAKEDGKPHIVKRVDKPSYRIIPELFGGGALPRKELHEAADELTPDEAALIVVGEPTLAKAFEEAVTGAVKTAQRAFNTASEDLLSAVKS